MTKKFNASAKLVAIPFRKTKDNLIPLYLKVIHQRVKKEYAIKKYVKEKEFNFETNRFIKSPKENIKLNAIEDKAVKIIDEMEHFSFHRFKELFFGKDVKRLTVVQYLEKLYLDNFEENRIGNATTFKNAKSAILRFKGSNLTFQDITPDYLKKLEKSLKDNGVGQATIGIYFRALRKAFNDAIKAGIVSQDLYPFLEYKIKTQKGKSKMALPKEDMIAIMNYPTDPGTHLRNSVNWFTLSYICRGMNFTDMCNLKWNENIQNDRIVYLRRKTENTVQEQDYISIKITEKIAAILEEYRENAPYILPVLQPGLSAKTEKNKIYGKLKVINKDLRSIAKELKIQNYLDLTFYVARHTFATVLALNGVAISEISESLKHSSTKTTESYLHTLTHRLDKNDELLF